jgi:electron transfer flavoprotein beta subunit
MGADRAIHVITDEETLPIHVAKCLKALVEKEEPQMVLLGKQAGHPCHSETAAALELGT